jgi:NAD(P)-dependent dehydrogenase (short-subunit alcohol dehydrogenase family)
VITGRDAQTLGAAQQQIGPDTLAIRSDIADLAALDEVYRQVRELHGRIDVLFVNAGVGGFVPAAAVTPEFWDSVHSVDLRGCFFAAQKALSLMGRDGAIVFTGSIGSQLAAPGNITYAAAKAGLRAVARNLASELLPQGIRVNMVSPGATETPILYRNPGMDEKAVDGLRKMMIANTPMKRMGTPEEIARAVLFLASGEASFITGVDLFVDGGVIEL